MRRKLMNRKLLLMSIGLVFLLAVALIAASGEKREAFKAEISPVNLQLDAERAACQMRKFDPGTGSIIYYTGYGNGDGCLTYFDPTDPADGGCGVAATYPFEITGVYIFLWDHVDAVWPVTVDVNVYDMATPGDACGGPGTLLCSETVSCDLATFGGDFGLVTFSTPCCVTGPFYVGFQYNDANSSAGYPALVFDASAIAPVPADCDLWDKYLGGPWTEWYSAWTTPPNYPMIIVNGETESQNCDTDPWANHKMHWPQLPDEDGWDVHVQNPMFLADDWTCSETGPVTDIHWWGSWLDEAEGVINSFVIKVWTDIPVDPPSIMYSRPGTQIWEFVAAAGTFDIIPLMPEDAAMWEGWYDPSLLYHIYPDHQEYFRYDLILPEQAWFDQIEGTVYWLSIECIVEDQGLEHYWGWKNTEDHHLDDAVFWNGMEWIEIYEPAEELSNWFEIQLDPTGMWVGGYGVGAYVDPADPSTNGWYFYEEDGWWNIWFYDHPLDYDRIKDIRIEYSVRPLEPENPEMYAEVTPNWATDLWTLEGPAPERPPLPGDFDYTATPPTPPEAEWIGRGDPPDIWQSEMPEASYRWRIPDYNPEWVSVDINGFNVWVEGTIYHTCKGSLDLAFVITSDFAPDPEGACCYDDPTGLGWMCVVTTQTDCEVNLGGVYQGDGTTCLGIEACCLGNGLCVTLDAICCDELGGTPQGSGTVCTATEGCCMSDNTCQMLDPLCCTDLGGSPQGQGTTCTSVEACCMPDNSCQMLDPLCCLDLGGTSHIGECAMTTRACCLADGSCQNLDPLCCVDLGGTPSLGQCSAPQACCFDDGSCQDLDPLCCVDLGGTPQGVGTICATTICEAVPDSPKNWYQPPDLSELGMDVNATFPLYVLADDFLCTETGGIQEIHIWGSWLNDIYPGGDPGGGIDGDAGNVRFHLSLHADIPAGAIEEWSMPGEMIADWYFEPGEFIYKEVKLEGAYEGWFNPPTEWIPDGDRNCWEYIFQFSDNNWFLQQGTAGAPIVYWLDVQAIIPDGVAPALFGWKTSIDHWNDDAVWFDGIDEPAPHPWFEMRYPFGHPFETESVDQAFMIGGPCDCEPGEVNVLPPVNILDIVYLIDYKYKSGAAPVPYALCSGDVNCDCLVNILDIIYLINYKYKSGPAPCTCGNFIANCPGGLR